jgi:hypothetical protein
MGADSLLTRWTGSSRTDGCDDRLLEPENMLGNDDRLLEPAREGTTPAPGGGGADAKSLASSSCAASSGSAPPLPTGDGVVSMPARFPERPKPSPPSG